MNRALQIASRTSLPTFGRLTTVSRLSALVSLSAFILSALALGCGAGAKQAEPEDPPLFEAEDESKLAPSSAAVEEGIKALKAEEFEKAESILTKAVADSPEDPQAVLYLGMAQEGLEKFDAAVASYSRAVEIAPKLVEANQHLSALLLDLERNQEALNAAEAGLKEEPNNAALLVNKAYATDLLGEPGKGNPAAIKAYETALAVDGENLNVRYYYALALAQNGDKEKALAQLKRLPLDGKFLPVVEIITVYGRLDAYDACVEALGVELEKEKTVELYVHRAACQSQAGHESAALADLKAAVATDPNSADAHYYLARHLTKSGKTAEARKELELAVKVGPETKAGQAAKKILEGK